MNEMIDERAAMLTSLVLTSSNYLELAHRCSGVSYAISLT